MHQILSRETIGPDVCRYVVEAPEIARRRKPGQFVIVRICEGGERIPLTIADADPQAGTITLIVQTVGKSTLQMSRMGPGDLLADVAGPLGRPTHIGNFGTVVCVAGGIGAAPLFPIVQALHLAGSRIVTLLCARNADLLIMEEDLKAVSDELIVMTDDGSRGIRGLSTDGIRMLVDRGLAIDHVFAIGPPVMMKFVCKLTGELGIPTTVSLNPIMIDGTGMCGGCRVTVGDATKFACVDGPEFDGLQVDFDELIRRLGAYKDREKEALEHFRSDCRLGQ